jgi:hypothetical protein
LLGSASATGEAVARVARRVAAKNFMVSGEVVEVKFGK